MESNLKIINKNNRGDISITILVLGVFAICILAMFSFFVSSISLRNSFVGVDLIEDVNRDMEIGELDNLPREIIQTSIWPWVKDELLVSIDYEKS